MSTRTATANPYVARAVVRHVRRTLRSRVRTLQAEGDQDFARDFPAVVKLVEAGLRHEEALMETFGDTDLHDRRERNAAILSALHHVATQVELGTLQQARTVTGALATVLAGH